MISRTAAMEENDNATHQSDRVDLRRRHGRRRGDAGSPHSAQSSAPPSIDLPNPYAPATSFGQLPAGRTWGGTTAVAVDRDGKSVWVFERCGAESCAAFEPPADPAFRPIRQTAGKFRCRHVRISALHRRRPRRQCVGHRRRRQERQGPGGGQVQPDRQGAADLGQGGHARRRSGLLQSAVRRGDRAQRRHLRGRRPRRGFQCARRQVLENRKVPDRMGQEGHRSGRVRHAARHRSGFARTGLCRRPFEQPDPGVRRGRQIPRRLAAVRPPERRVYRCERRDLCRRFTDRGQDRLHHGPGLPPRHPHRQCGGWRR